MEEEERVRARDAEHVAALQSMDATRAMRMRLRSANPLTQVKRARTEVGAQPARRGGGVDMLPRGFEGQTEEVWCAMGNAA